MSALTDMIVNQTDPVTALLIVGLGGLVVAVDRRHKRRNEQMRQEIKDEMHRLRNRLNRLEDTYIPDGGNARGGD